MVAKLRFGRKQDPKEALREVFGDYELPTFPRIVNEAISMISSADVNLSDVGELLGKDPGAASSCWMHGARQTIRCPGSWRRSWRETSAPRRAWRGGSSCASPAKLPTARGPTKRRHMLVISSETVAVEAARLSPNRTNRRI